jgi:PqqD family protein of HPr-rel-A system
LTWAVRRSADFHLHSWDDGTAVFDELTGHLHCVNPLAGQLLEVALTRPQWSTYELAQEFLGEIPLPEDQELVENVLSALTSSHIIERVAV